MPQQTDSALRTRLCRIADRDVQEKVRVAGRVLYYEAKSAMLTLIDGHQGLLVDTSLALDSQSHLWASERLSTVIVIGRIDKVQKALKLPPKPIPSPELDLEMWNSVLEEEEREHEDVSTSATT
ncbi:hypothetical protein D9613_000788 [Agrocybe pediades]|uniref:Uncharacterized protein n=1 Tax=Agrocybe pediades TaxID=84607 RepID=A0A8H4VUC1_9AGAR|nr:hypothetical protein D9613_000788 [Agrocybe pediades]